MKFTYIDESGSCGEGDIFVMAGLLIDAYRLRKYTARFDKELSAFLAKHPTAPRELKTKAFLNGRDGWNKVSPDERKKFIKDMCKLAAECSTIYAFGMSFKAFDTACKSTNYSLPCSKNYWALSGMFISGLIQKKQQTESNNKGLTVLIFDDNKADMPKVSNEFYMANPWFDALYQKNKKVRGRSQWCPRKKEDRFDCIINTAFAIKSEHSSLIQVADVVSYIYRHHLELISHAEAYSGEKEFYASLVKDLEDKRERLGRTSDSECVQFYNEIKYPDWEI